MRRSWVSPLMEPGKSLAGPFMASQKDKRSAWVGFISNGQCFALMSRGEQYWLVESKEAALRRLLMVMVDKARLEKGLFQEILGTARKRLV